MLATSLKLFDVFYIRRLRHRMPSNKIDYHFNAARPRIDFLIQLDFKHTIILQGSAAQD